jgi:hypothetical protein
MLKSLRRFVIAGAMLFATFVVTGQEARAQEYNTCQSVWEFCYYSGGEFTMYMCGPTHCAYSCSAGGGWSDFCRAW